MVSGGFRCFFLLCCSKINIAPKHLNESLKGASSIVRRECTRIVQKTHDVSRRWYSLFYLFIFTQSRWECCAQLSSMESMSWNYDVIISLLDIWFILLFFLVDSLDAGVQKSKRVFISREIFKYNEIRVTFLFSSSFCIWFISRWRKKEKRWERKSKNKMRCIDLWWEFHRVADAIISFRLQ